jgi:hypothetical protein
MKHAADFETTVAGIPCGIVITHYLIDRADDGDFVERDWFVVDSKGYRADWLNTKITDKEERRINREIDEVMA